MPHRLPVPPEPLPLQLKRLWRRCVSDTGFRPKVYSCAGRRGWRSAAQYRCGYATDWAGGDEGVEGTENGGAATTGTLLIMSILS